MAGAISSGILSQHEYDAVIRTLSATVKGRAFLREFSERSRPEENRKLLDSVRQMEASLTVAQEQLLPGQIALALNRIAGDLSDSTQSPDQKDQAISDLTRLAEELMKMDKAEPKAVDSSD